MNPPKVFCEECRNDVDYTVSELPLTGTVKGTAYSYTGREARCKDCHALVYVPELNDSNLNMLYDVFREKNGIISLAQIQAIPEKYAIGKRPLSLLLGWGEQTFSRYYDGDLPTRQYSDILLRIYREPAFYSKLLEAKKGNLKSALTYEKSRRATNALLDKEGSKGSKIDSVIPYLLSRCEDITPLALQKALYYIQGFYYAFYKEFLFAENCQAWVHGPVYKDIYLRYRDYRFDPIEQTTVFDAAAFSAEEQAVYDSVIHHICCYSGGVLERFTHQEAPWLVTRGDFPITAPSDRIIEKELIGSYFETVKETYQMETPGDIKKYTDAMFFHTQQR